MAIGQPDSVANAVLGRPFVRFAHVVGWVYLAGAAIELLGYQGEYPSDQLWSALIPVAVMAALLAVLNIQRSFIGAIVYVAVGGVAIYITAVLVFGLGHDTQTTDAVPLTMMKIALIMVGGASGGPWRALAWTVGAFVVGEVAVSAAALQSSARITPDASTIATVATLALVLSTVGMTRAARTRARPTLAQAARDEEASEIRYRIEVRAAALMHDTILSHLAAVSHSQTGPLRPELRREIEEDLAVLLGEEWLSEPATDDGRGTERANWRHSALFEAVQEVRDSNLKVEVTGDLAAVGRLSRERDQAIGLAVKQCLVNVLNHAEVDSAEVVIIGAARELSVMVIDAGRGFEEASVGADRLGIRQSVRHRIEEVGGAVQIWSTPGRGTSVMIRVPLSELVHGASRDVERDPGEAIDV